MIIDTSKILSSMKGKWQIPACYGMIGIIIGQITRSFWEMIITLICLCTTVAVIRYLDMKDMKKELAEKKEEKNEVGNSIDKHPQLKMNKENSNETKEEIS